MIDARRRAGASALPSGNCCIVQPIDGLRELRFAIGHDSSRIRVTYWLASGRRIVLVTVFRKTRMREHSEVERAHQAMKTCHAEHLPAGAHDMFTRDVQKGDGQ